MVTLRTEIINTLNEKNLDFAKTIRKKNKIRGSSPDAYAFIITILKLIYPKITKTQLADSITDNYEDGEVDAIIISDKDKTISVFDVKTTNSFKYNDIKLFRNNIKEYILNADTSLDGLFVKVKIHIENARNLLVNNNDWALNIYVVRLKGQKPNSSTTRLLKKLETDFASVKSYYFLNSENLIEEFLPDKTKHNNYDWNAKICSSKDTEPVDTIIIKNNSNSTIKSLFARLTLSEIVKLQKTFIDKNYDLFGANVRDFQKSKNLSEKIITSIKTNPKEFYIYHNGLTFSCLRIEKRTANSFRIQNPQIINGCQTVNTIYNEYKDDINNNVLSKATILCRFYALENKEIEKVCEATNTQIKISLWDLRTNDEIQKIIEYGLNAKDYNYKRKVTKGNTQKFFMTDLAQWIYSCQYEEPAAAKNKKSELFNLLRKTPENKTPYEKIFNEKIKLERVFKICDIALFVKDRISKINKKERTFEKDAELHFIAAIFKLENNTNKSMIWKFNKGKAFIKQAINKLRGKYGADYSYNKIFSKTGETWSIVKQKIDNM